MRFRIACAAVSRKADLLAFRAGAMTVKLLFASGIRLPQRNMATSFLIRSTPKSSMAGSSVGMIGGRGKRKISRRNLFVARTSAY